MRNLYFVFIGIIILFGFSPITLYAFSGEGGGVEGDPYIIELCSQLPEINLELTAHYKLGDTYGDLGCSDESFPLAREMEGSELVGDGFQGVFDGSGYRISYNLNNIPALVDDSNYLGFFGLINGGTVKNLELSISVLDGGGINGATNIGSLAAKAVGATIINVSSNVDIDAESDNVGGLIGVSESTRIIGSSYGGTIESEGDNVGGLVGKVEGDTGSSAISRSFAVGSVSGVDHVGGLVGYLGDNIDNSYADVDVTSLTGFNLGGLVGTSVGGLEINNSYAIGQVNAQDYVGGLIGQTITDTTTILNSFAATPFTGPASSIGGIIGRNDFEAVFEKVYWDRSLITNDCYSGSGGDYTGCESVDNTLSPNYWDSESVDPMSAWDFGDIWTIDTPGNTPTLQVYVETFVPDQVTGLSVSEVSSTQVLLEWDEPSDGGDPISNYIIQWRVVGAPIYTTISHSPSAATSINLGGLTAGVNYQFRVAAVNDVGTGPNSSPFSFSIAVPPTTDPDETEEYNGRSGQRVMPVARSTSETLRSLQVQLQNLLVLVNKLYPSPSTAFIRNLSIGLHGSDVEALQRFLIEKNKGPAAARLARVGATGYFGPLTQAALGELQGSVGITPASGYFGPKTRVWVENN